MRISRVNKKKNMLKDLMGHLFGQAYAVEGAEAGVQTQATVGTQTTAGASVEPSVTTNVSNPQTVDFESILANVRKEEKDKLYPKLNQAKLDAQEKQTRINDLILQIGTKDVRIKELEAEVANLKSGASNADEVSKLQKELDDTKKLLKDAENKNVQIELDYFRDSEITKAGGNIIPELVVGSTKEEIIASIENSKKRYVEIAGDKAKETFNTNVQETKRTSTQQVLAGLNPSTSAVSGNAQINLNDLDLTKPEDYELYKKFRRQLLNN